MLLGICCNPFKGLSKQRLLVWRNVDITKKGCNFPAAKKNKDTLLLKNWRPITLLNVDYKIATKCIAKRLEKVLPEVINRDQMGYVNNCFIGENTQLISDVMELYEKKTCQACFFS